MRNSENPNEINMAVEEMTKEAEDKAILEAALENAEDEATQEAVKPMEKAAREDELREANESKLARLSKFAEQTEEEDFEVIKSVSNSRTNRPDSPERTKDIKNVAEEIKKTGEDTKAKEKAEENIKHWEKQLEGAGKDSSKYAERYIAQRNLEKYKKDLESLTKPKNASQKPGSSEGVASQEAPKGTETGPKGDPKKAEEEKKKQEAAQAAKTAASRAGSQNAGASSAAAYRGSGTGTYISQSMEHTSNWFNIFNTESLLEQLESVGTSNSEIDEYIKSIGRLTEEGKFGAADILKAEVSPKIEKGRKIGRVRFMKDTRNRFKLSIKHLKEQAKKGSKLDKEAVKLEIKRQKGAYREFNRGAKDRGLVSSGWAWNPANWLSSNRMVTGPQAPAAAAGSMEAPRAETPGQTPATPVAESTPQTAPQTPQTGSAQTANTPPTTPQTPPSTPPAPGGTI